MALWTGGPHPTSGLAGYPARDFGAPGGTPVFSWSTLKVRRISGATGYRGGGFGGFNLYLTDPRGREYFMTHIENLRVKVGDVLRPGQQIAVVGNYGTPHVHLGYTGGDPVSVLGLKPEYLFTPGGSSVGASVVADGSRRAASIPRLQDTQPQAAGFLPGGAAGDLLRPLVVPGEALGKALDVTGFDTAADVVTAPARAVAWTFGNWDRVLEVLAGFLLLIVGLVLMGRSLGVTKQRIEVVESRLPASVTGRAPVEAREEPVRVPSSRRVYEATDEGERRAARRSRARRASSAQADDVPF